MSFAAFGFKMLDKLGTNLSDTYGTGNTLRDAQRKEQHDDYLAREREGIQSRVDGAKAAGLHPLVALGYQSGPGPTSVVGSDSGPQYTDPPPPVERAQRDAPDPSITRYNEARARLAEAQATQAERDLEAGRTRLATQPGNPPVYPTEPENLPRGQGSSSTGIRVKPNEIISSINGIEVGVQPSGARIRGTDGYLYKGLSENALKQTEDMELLRLGLYAYMNRLNILDKIGFNDYRFKFQKALQDRDQARSTKAEDNRELRRLINQSRARSGY